MCLRFLDALFHPYGAVQRCDFFPKLPRVLPVALLLSDQGMNPKRISHLQQPVGPRWGLHTIKRDNFRYPFLRNVEPAILTRDIRDVPQRVRVLRSIHTAPKFRRPRIRAFRLRQVTAIALQAPLLYQRPGLHRGFCCCVHT